MDLEPEAVTNTELRGEYQLVASQMSMESHRSGESEEKADLLLLRVIFFHGGLMLVHVVWGEIANRNEEYVLQADRDTPDLSVVEMTPSAPPTYHSYPSHSAAPPSSVPAFPWLRQTCLCQCSAWIP
ncbi:uncharacterized protein ARMOST_04249 [Armillaria ostoyae]|uniref:Uncharacterized protein n=1 Tax=Armillaria ostoyae TaxID=47428 RepID=A0A284QWV7_ARMOS|nr:uncharacterized protein ARMOST_04249 [Armillaria ostoyae]